MENSFLNYFLPEKLLEHFVITQVEELGCVFTKKMVLHIHLEEINTIPLVYDSSQYESKGFYPAKTIQDFPVRGKAVYLVIKRRRWRHKDRKDETIYNDYSFIAEGLKLTSELSLFLKGRDWYKGGYDK